MNNEINLFDVPLSRLTNESRNLLSCLLNTTKIIASDGPEKLPRDWRGLASLAQISAEVASNINLYPDKTAKVLEIWMNHSQNTAYVGNLLQFLQRLDRYDVCDDCLELHRQGQLIDIPNENQAQVALDIPDDDRLITYEDQKYGEPQFYHAFVLFAQEDKDFVDELLQRMRQENLRLCTLDDLLPGHATQYTPVSKLIKERCQRIILVCSPEFLRSPANSFYTEFAQAVGIENKERKIIPLMYRECHLPSPLSYYHKLHYSPPGQKTSYDFWQKLSHSLQVNNIARINNTNSSHSALRITEVNSNTMLDSRNIARNTNSAINFRKITNGYPEKKTEQLQLPGIPPVKSESMSCLDSRSIGQISQEDSKSHCSLNQSPKRKAKKPNKIKDFISSLTRKKNKEAIPLDG
ncbi:unnamed protein product, partial [Iphiclides podalirius]